MGTATGSTRNKVKKGRRKPPPAGSSTPANDAGAAEATGAPKASRRSARAAKPPKSTKARGTSKPGPLPELQRPTDLEVDPDVMEFIAAIDAYKKRHSRPFPTWSEILYILRQLGYRREK